MPPWCCSRQLCNPEEAKAPDGIQKKHLCMVQGRPQALYTGVQLRILTPKRRRLVAICLSRLEAVQQDGKFHTIHSAPSGYRAVRFDAASSP